ncbi:MAG: MOSC domain-containing protein [Spirochaetes bacterium]|nr:MAG: MOSC domain-containing protein [Spirochaetota bacterium]
MEFGSGKVVGLAISDKKGTQKKSVKKIKLVEGIGIEGDAHRGSYRQVSVLSIEERDKIALRKLKPGEAAENILIDGIDNLSSMAMGAKIKIGESVILRVIQIGKEFHESPIHEFTGRPVLPNVGVFCSVFKGGIVQLNDSVRIVE